MITLADVLALLWVGWLVSMGVSSILIRRRIDAFGLDSPGEEWHLNYLSAITYGRYKAGWYGDHEYIAIKPHLSIPFLCRVEHTDAGDGTYSAAETQLVATWQRPAAALAIVAEHMTGGRR